VVNLLRRPSSHKLLDVERVHRKIQAVRHPSASGPSYRLIAERAGVSLSTVSYAFQDSPKLTRETKELVARVAVELGYKPNPLLNSLLKQVRNNRQVDLHGVIAALCHGETANPRIPHFIHGWRQGAEQAAAQAGYRLDLFSVDDPDLPISRLSTILRARGVRAVLVPPLGREVQSLPESLFQNMAAAAIGNYLRQPCLNRAAADQYGATLDALDEVERRGYLQAGLVVHEGTHFGGRCRFAAAFGWWHLERGRRAAKPFLLKHDTHAERDRFLNWIRKRRFDLIICGSTPDPIIGWLEDEWKIPEELGFISLTVMTESSCVTGMKVNAAGIGAAAVDLLLGQLSRNETGVPCHPRVVLLSNEWMEGRTVRPAPQPSS